MYSSPAELLSPFQTRLSLLWCVSPLVAESHVSRVPPRWPQAPMNVGILPQGTEIIHSFIVTAVTMVVAAFPMIAWTH
ncbi:hypothetical protein EDD17DRAFT_1591825 [Pisolithus thermaeus]|nr:hypothetical protein EDD17DRAFT_1591825 [Pisolithus thermaeus]